MDEEMNNKRRPVMKRKGGMEMVIAIGAKPKMKPPEEDAEGYEDDMCECPKCGHQFSPNSGDDSEDDSEQEEQD